MRFSDVGLVYISTVNSGAGESPRPPTRLLLSHSVLLSKKCYIGFVGGGCPRLFERASPKEH